MTRSPIALLFLLAPACGSPAPAVGASPLMSFDRTSGLYAAPFPSDDLRRADGTIDLTRYPNPDKITLISQALALLGATGASGHPGFAMTGAVYFQMSAPLDPTRLPSLAQSLSPDAPAFLINVDANSPLKGHRSPALVSFDPMGGPFGAPNLLSLLPLQGVPLLPATRYAAVVRARLRDANGQLLTPSPQMTALLHGNAPDGLTSIALTNYQEALTTLEQLDPALDDIVGLAVFTTGDPVAELRRAVTSASVTLPLMPAAKPTLDVVFPDYCVYKTTIEMPDYQSGTAPFSRSGGQWQWASPTELQLQRMDLSTLYFTVPRRATPTAGFPVVLFVRTGAGGDRPIVDRGTQSSNDSGPIVPGTGPARFFALQGYAGVSVDGPLGGLRNPDGLNEDFTIFNVFNAGALRDNLRESALELALFARSMGQWQFDASDCPGAGNPVTFDMTHAALMGHSMGASIAPLTFSVTPQLGALILSGAGGSWIENVVYKQMPTNVRPLADALLNYDSYDRDLTESDPALTLVQWAAESADCQVYDAQSVIDPTGKTPPRHVLKLQGIVDHYILPPIANTTSLSLGLDLAGPPLDASPPEPPGMAPLADVLPYSGRSAIALPARANIGAKATALVIQHAADTLLDGHEVVFQTDPPKHQYSCFLQSWLTGIPTVPPDAPADAPCP